MDDIFDDDSKMFDENDPFSYSKSKVHEKSSFMSYSKENSSTVSGNLSSLSLRERAKLMLSASQESSKVKSSKKSRKKGRKKVKKKIKGQKLVHSTSTDSKSNKLSSTTSSIVDNRWSSRFDELDEGLDIDETLWETPEQKAEREEQEAAQLAAEVEASSITNAEDSIHRLSQSGFNGAVDDPLENETSQEEEEEEIDILSMTVNEIKDIQARNLLIQQRKIEKERRKQEKEQAQKHSRIQDIAHSLRQACDVGQITLKEEEDHGSLSQILSAKKMADQIETLRNTMTRAEQDDVVDDIETNLLDDAEDIIEQLEEALATQIEREGDIDRLQEAMKIAMTSEDPKRLILVLAEVKNAQRLHLSHDIVKQASSLVSKLEEQKEIANKKAEQESQALELQNILQAAYDAAHDQELFSDAQRALIPSLKEALHAAKISKLFDEGDYLVEDAQDLVERVESKFARQLMKEAYSHLKQTYQEQDDAYTDNGGDYSKLKSAIDKAVASGTSTTDKLVEMANLLLVDLKEDYDKLLAKREKEERAERAQKQKAMKALQTAITTGRTLADASKNLDGINALKIQVNDQNIQTLEDAISVARHCGDDALVKEAEQLAKTLEGYNMARKQAEIQAEEERKRKQEEKAARKAAKAKKKEEWKKKILDATTAAKESRKQIPLQMVIDEAEREGVLQQRYEDDTFVSATMQSAVDLVSTLIAEEAALKTAKLMAEKKAAEEAAKMCMQDGEKAVTASAASLASTDASQTREQLAGNIETNFSNSAINLDVTPPVPAFESSFAQGIQDATVSSPDSNIHKLTPQQRPTTPQPKRDVAVKAMKGGQSPQTPLLVNAAASPNVSQHIGEHILDPRRHTRQQSGEVQQNFAQDPKLVNLNRLSSISIKDSQPYVPRVMMGPPTRPLFGSSSLQNSHAMYPQLQLSYSDHLSRSGSNIDASQLAASMSMNYDTDSEADEEAKKMFWNVMRGSEKVLRKSLGRRRRAEAKAMALALSAKDKAIADLSARIEQMQLDAAKAAAEGIVREEKLREELDIAESNAQTLQERIDNLQKIEGSPAELALLQIKKKINGISHGVDIEESELSMQEFSTLKHEIVSIRKEFVVLEHLIHGYQSENVKMVSQLKQQKLDAARAKTEFQCENAKFQQQLERNRILLVQSETDHSTTALQNAIENDSNSSLEKGAPSATQKPQIPSSEPQNRSYSQLRESLSRDQELHDLRNFIAEQREQHTNQVMMLRNKQVDLEKERNQLEGLVRNLRLHNHHLEESYRSEHERATGLVQQLKNMHLQHQVAENHLDSNNKGPLQDSNHENSTYHTQIQIKEKLPSRVLSDDVDNMLIPKNIDMHKSMQFLKKVNADLTCKLEAMEKEIKLQNEKMQQEKKKSAKMAARYERQLLRVQGTNKNNKTKIKHTDSKVSQSSKRIELVEAEQESLIQQNNYLRHQLQLEKGRTAHLQSEQNQKLLHMQLNSHPDSDVPKTPTASPFLRKGGGARADSANTDRSATRKSTATKSHVSKRRITQRNSRQSHEDQEAILRDEIKKFEEQLHDAEVARMELKRALTADVESQAQEVQQVRKDMAKATRKKMSELSEQHDKAIQNLQTKHAQHLATALREKSKAEIALGSAQMRTKDLLAENDMLIRTKQHPKARAFHDLNSRINEIEERNRTREAELQSVIAQGKQARHAERDVYTRKFVAEIKQKDEQIRLFRLELDSIMDVLRALRSSVKISNATGIALTQPAEMRSSSLIPRMHVEDGQMHYGTRTADDESLHHLGHQQILTTTPKHSGTNGLRLSTLMTPQTIFATTSASNLQ